MTNSRRAAALLRLLAVSHASAFDLSSVPLPAKLDPLAVAYSTAAEVAAEDVKAVK